MAYQEDQFLISSNQELIEYVVSRLAVKPIVLDEERKDSEVSKKRRLRCRMILRRAFFVRQREAAPTTLMEQK